MKIINKYGLDNLKNSLNKYSFLNEENKDSVNRASFVLKINFSELRSVEKEELDHFNRSNARDCAKEIFSTYTKKEMEMIIDALYREIALDELGLINKLYC